MGTLSPAPWTHPGRGPLLPGAGGAAGPWCGRVGAEGGSAGGWALDPQRDPHGTHLRPPTAHIPAAAANRSGPFAWGASPTPQRPPARRAENCLARGMGGQQPSPRLWGSRCHLPLRVMASSGSPQNPPVLARVPPRYRVPPSRDTRWFWGARCPHPPPLGGQRSHLHG